MFKSKKFYADTPKARLIPCDDGSDLCLYLKPIYLKSKNTQRKSILTRNKVKRDMGKLLELTKMLNPKLQVLH